MSKPKDTSGGGRSQDLQAFLVSSIENLRASAEERKKLPALDRLLSRIEAREGRIVPSEPAVGTLRRWVRPLVPSLTGAAAGFAGAALALVLLSPSAERGVSRPPAEVVEALSGATQSSLDRSIRRLERAVRGLEKFQPLVESRIEWVEDVIQREHAGAYATLDDTTRGPNPERGVTAATHRGNGV